VMKSKP